MAITDQTRSELVELAARYPQAKSAVMPMLHLLQSVEDAITSDGIHVCADVLGISEAEVNAVATFYSMYDSSEWGQHHIGVCTNTLCGLLGGDAVFDRLCDRLGLPAEGTTADGQFTLNRIECQAACTHAPVMTAYWEFIDDVTPTSAVDVVDRLARGERVESTRGPVVRGLRATERTLAFPDDGLAGDGRVVDDKMLAGLRVAKERGMTAPQVQGG
ncbi:MAG: NAD(P)H-dependent oxidoreductase subunit E [Candidatus Nanopelagicales bacterium]|nr:NAD(P)H-dependent oxidoreductase subunit E [Candidatus Nanopelagicales bacterium]